MQIKKYRYEMILNWCCVRTLFLQPHGLLLLLLILILILILILNFILNL